MCRVLHLGALQDIIVGADYLGINLVTEFACATFATWFKSKSPEQICELFGADIGTIDIDQVNEIKKLQKEHFERKKSQTF